ncbi:MAG: 4a-hydroxytetrahydrobiopterin dehydratase [Rhodothermales bacterium]|nr:4a-hydroxytetrahydrobiopterin dehydratase [Rhodothermales bacterium]
MQRTPLTPEEIDDALGSLPGWRLEDDQLKKTFELENFRAAVSFIVRLAFHAEELDHHPDLHNVYNTVDIALTTHDAGDRVTEMDVKLAHAIEDFTWV